VMQLDGDLKGVSVQPVYSTDSLPPRWAWDAVTRCLRIPSALTQ
jgi:hypothetical protein